MPHKNDEAGTNALSNKSTAYFSSEANIATVASETSSFSQALNLSSQKDRSKIVSKVPTVQKYRVILPAITPPKVLPMDITSHSSAIRNVLFRAYTVLFRACPLTHAPPYEMEPMPLRL